MNGDWYIRINCCIQAEMQHTSTAQKQSHKTQRKFDYYAFLGCKRNLPFFFAYVSNVIEWSLAKTLCGSKICIKGFFSIVHQWTSPWFTLVHQRYFKQINISPILIFLIFFIFGFPFSTLKQGPGSWESEALI